MRRRQRVTTSIMDETSVVAGGLPVPDVQEKPLPAHCQHQFKMERTLIKRHDIFGTRETLAIAVYCSLCGTLKSSARITA